MNSGADGDLVGWIDQRLQQASNGSIRGRVVRMRNVLVEPMQNLLGVSDKVLNMTLAYVLTSAPATKPLWLETDATMIAIDRLVWPRLMA